MKILTIWCNPSIFVKFYRYKYSALNRHPLSSNYHQQSEITFELYIRTLYIFRYSIRTQFKHMNMSFLVLIQAIVRETSNATSEWNMIHTWIAYHYLLSIPYHHSCPKISYLWPILIFFFQSANPEMQQCPPPGLVRALSRSEIHPNEAPLVVEGKSGVRSVGCDTASYGSGTVSRGRPLCGWWLPLSAGVNAEKSRWARHQMQHTVIGNVFEDIQLLHVHQ